MSPSWWRWRRGGGGRGGGGGRNPHLVIYRRYRVSTRRFSANLWQTGEKVGDLEGFAEKHNLLLVLFTEEDLSDALVGKRAGVCRSLQEDGNVLQLDESLGIVGNRSDVKTVVVQ
jgi:hypothetical protein